MGWLANPSKPSSVQERRIMHDPFYLGIEAVGLAERWIADRDYRYGGAVYSADMWMVDDFCCVVFHLHFSSRVVNFLPLLPWSIKSIKFRLYFQTPLHPSASNSVAPLLRLGSYLKSLCAGPRNISLESALTGQ